MAAIRADLSQYYAMKALFEQVLGRASFRRVKDDAPLPVWKAESRKLIKALRVSIASTVEVVDDEWKGEVKQLLDQGLSRISSSASIDQLFASLAATLGELAFLQIGFVPKGHWRVDRIPLIAQNWKLTHVRTVQYVQSSAQWAAQVRIRKRGIPNGET